MTLLYFIDKLQKKKCKGKENPAHYNFLGYPYTLATIDSQKGDRRENPYGISMEGIFNVISSQKDFRA